MRRTREIEIKWAIPNKLGLVVFTACPKGGKIKALEHYFSHIGGIITVSNECYPTQNELIELEHASIKWIHIPIDLLEVPRNIHLTLNVAEFIDEINNDNQAVLIMCFGSCFLGKVLAMAYFLTKGFPFDTASELILSKKELEDLKKDKKFFKYLKFMETFRQKQLAY